MILRPRQKIFVDKSASALRDRGNALGVAPTGAGKTVMLSAITGEALPKGGKGIILQHRDELVDQNHRTFRAFHGNAFQTGVIDAKRKEFHRDVIFAMAQTLTGDKNLDAMRPVDFLAIDEAHHAVAESYRKIIDRALVLNPETKIFGVTATPNRGDKKALREVFDNVSDQIMLGELIAAGHLVKPRTFVLDIGVKDALSQVRRQLSDFDMSEVEKIMDKVVLNDRIVEEWKRLAGDRQTIVFCSTVDHAKHVCDAYKAAGITCDYIDSRPGTGGREAKIAKFEALQTQVLVNVAILTEGYDHPPTSCIVLLRPSSFKSTMIQMVGRGLRTIDPEKYPGIVKSDCVVLDFGTSTLTHGSLEQDVNLDGGMKGAAPTKVCPQCEAQVPMSAAECAICCYAFSVENGESDPTEKETLDTFGMTEVDLFNASPFKWEDIWEDGSMLVADGFDAWAMTINYDGSWHAVGGAKGSGIRHLAVGEQMIALAMADDFLREHGDSDGAAKSRRWLHMPATDRQAHYLGVDRAAAASMTRYRAACHLTFKFNEKGVRNRLQGAARAAA